MQETLPTPDELQQHACVQALANSYALYAKAYVGTIAQQADAPSKTSGAFANNQPVDIQAANTNNDNPHQSNNPGPRLWLACSGGRDSLSLALAAWALKLPITLIHINHQLQSEADTWQAVVEAFAAKLKIPFESEALNLNSSDEASARASRFLAIAKKMQATDVLMLGHHMDDQAETLLLNLFRGAGLRGLSAMLPWQRQDIDGKQIVLWRPWLAIRRDEITQFASDTNLTYVDDPTNTLPSPCDADLPKSKNQKQPIFNLANETKEEVDGFQNINSRAFLRSLTLPHLAARFGDVVPAIARTSSIAGEAQDILKEVLESDKALVLEGSQKNELIIGKFKQLSTARQFQLLADFIKSDSPYAATRQQVEQVLKVTLQQSCDQKFCFEFASRQIRRFQDKLYRLPANLEQANDACICLKLGDVVTLASGVWQVEQAASGLSLSFLETELFLRPKQAGERFHSEGRVGSWPLKKFFQSINLPPWQRQQAQLLCDTQKTPIALVCAAGFFVREGSLVDQGFRLKRL